MILFSNTFNNRFHSWSMCNNRSVCTQWEWEYKYNKFVDKGEVWNIILRCPM